MGRCDDRNLRDVHTGREVLLRDHDAPDDADDEQDDAGRLHDDAVGGRTPGSSTISPVAFGARRHRDLTPSLLASARICSVVFAIAAQRSSNWRRPTLAVFASIPIPP